MAQLFDDVPDPLEAGRRNWEATAEGALELGALWFELATHAMHGEPHAAGLEEVMVASQLRAFTDVYAAHTDRPHADAPGPADARRRPGPALRPARGRRPRPPRTPRSSSLTAMVRRELWPDP